MFSIAFIILTPLPQRKVEEEEKDKLCFVVLVVRLKSSKVVNHT
jgi:hypothetical protein